MDMKPIKHEKEKVTFLIKDAAPSIVNALRRTIMEEVPVMAIEDVEIRQNSSVLYDEVIALRLGLLPLSTDLKSYNLPSECKCKGEGCALCQLKLTLKAKGPETVYAGDIKSKDPKVKPEYPKMPIVKLIEGQEIELEATAVLGKGRQHAKWSPGIAYYQQSPEIEAGEKTEEAERLVASLPKQKVLEIKGNKITVDKEELLNDPKIAEMIEGKTDSIKVTYKEDEFIFTIESWGQLSPKKMLTEAATILAGKAEELSKKIKE